jgi:hypothetical protein
MRTVMVGSIGICLSSCLIILFSNQIRKTLSLPYQLSYDFSSYVHPATKQLITTLLTPTLVSCCNAQQLLEKVQQQVPTITAIHIYKQRPWHLHIKILSPSPLLALNNEFILTGTHLVHRAFFTENSLEGLPLLNVDEQVLWLTGEAQRLYTFFTSLPSTIRENYTISWHNKTMIILHKKSPGTSILCNYTTHFTQKLQQALGHLDTLISQRSKKKKKWYADIRFNGFIVVSPT